MKGKDICLIFRSWRGLYETLECATGEYSVENMTLYLEKRHVDLIANIQYFKSPNNDSNTKLKSISDFCQSKKEIVLKFSQKAYLDELQAKELLDSYTVNLGMKDYDDSVINSVLEFYLVEREAILLTLAAIFRIYDDESHFYHESCKHFIKLALKKGGEAFTDGILSSLCLLFGKPFMQSTYLTSADAYSVWVKQALTEEKRLLEVLFLAHYKAIHCPPKRVISLYKTLKQSQFGMKQGFDFVPDDESQVLWTQVVHLVVLNLMEVFYMEILLDATSVHDSRCQNTFVDCPEEAIEMTQLLEMAFKEGVDIQPISLLFLAWGSTSYLLLTLLEMNVPTSHQHLFEYLRGGSMVGSKSQLLVQKAYQMNALGYIHDILKTPLYDMGQTNTIGYKSVLKGLFSVFFSG